MRHPSWRALAIGLALLLVVACIGCSKVEVKTVTREEPIAFKKVEREDASLFKGVRRTDQEGADGVASVTYEQKWVNDKMESETKKGSKTVRKPVDEIVVVGTSEGHIVYVKSKNELWIAKPDGSDQRRVWSAGDGEINGPDLGGGGQGLVGASVGGRVAVPVWHRSGGTEVFVVDTSSGKTQAVPDASRFVSFSPDGRSLYFIQATADYRIPDWLSAFDVETVAVRPVSKVGAAATSHLAGMDSVCSTVLVLRSPCDLSGATSEGPVRFDSRDPIGECRVQMRKLWRNVSGLRDPGAMSPLPDMGECPMHQLRPHRRRQCVHQQRRPLSQV